MKLKRIAAVICSLCTLTSSFAFAREYSEEYLILDQMAQYVSELYVDETLTKEEAMKLAISGLLAEDEETMVKALKSMLSGVSYI